MTSKQLRAILIVALAAACGAFEDRAHADLRFESEFPSYTVVPDGSTQVSVKVYLAETGGTQLSSEGGLNSAGFQVIAVSPPSIPVSLVSITENAAFTGNVVKNLPAGSLYEEFPNLTSGVLPDASNRILLGTFAYTAALGAGSTTFSIQDKAGTDTFTVQGTNLDALITAGQFTIAPVPEPAAMGLALLALPLVARRRRRR
jgi:hypothetical protein